MEYRKNPMSSSLIKLFYKKQPQLSEKLLKRHDVYNRSVELLKQWEDEGKAFVIRPSKPIEIGRIETNPDKLQAVYDLGVKDATECLVELQKYISR